MNHAPCRFTMALGVLSLCLPATAAAQVSKSAGVAKELVQVLNEKKLEAIAAKVPTGDGNFAAALYFPNVQLLVIAGNYSAPQLMEPRLAGKQYRDTYMELSGTIPPNSKIFVQDISASFMAADGTLPKEIMPDKLHLSGQGYELWAKAIEPKLKELGL